MDILQSILDDVFMKVYGLEKILPYQTLMEFAMM